MLKAVVYIYIYKNACNKGMVLIMYIINYVIVLIVRKYLPKTVPQHGSSQFTFKRVGECDVPVSEVRTCRDGD